METSKKLYRVKDKEVFGGVCAGLAEYFNIDVVLVRVIFVLLALFGGGGVLIYIILWIAVPNKPYQHPNIKNETDSDPSVVNTEEVKKKETESNSNGGLIAGVILILLGVIFLGQRIFPIYNIGDLWPLILVVVGVILIKPDIFKSNKK
ncbi:MAG: PspC domain-containing protein [Lentimicrobiaceae bacterium]|jgi:phage shock protein C|nr:PspC domain-containing protein [Lentimicrobiaceae bacterium]MCP4910194.1 PspC domain-containing protein [Bacteroidota bacterium]MBT3453771.1 PspC domain-containing protein [Lentimicrobiaceae bacterium]MBT3819450.1 PspC domain-containing protein [Lentimicrobiaceae bacterium]MBT4061591.1 PspC domain-containing protein [Lentimicrobiaceae bacterium]